MAIVLYIFGLCGVIVSVAARVLFILLGKAFPAALSGIYTEWLITCTALLIAAIATQVVIPKK